MPPSNPLKIPRTEEGSLRLFPLQTAVPRQLGKSILQSIGEKSRGHKFQKTLVKS